MCDSNRFVQGYLLIGILLLPFYAAAEVFKCRDEATGKITFTDTACPDKGTGDYVPVGQANSDSGYTSGRARQRQQADRQRAEEANAQRWVDEADAVAESDRVEAHEKNIGRLEWKAGVETDPLDRASLRKEAEIEREAAAFGGNEEAERHYKKAAKARDKSRDANTFSERAKHVGQANA